MKRFIWNYKASILIVAGIILFCSFHEVVGRNTVLNATHFSLEVFKIFPAILVLMGLIDVWIPESFIENNLGNAAGMKGPIISLLLGSFASGPLFASFPLALTLLKKGGRLQNVVIFIGAWSTIKIPMILMESSFLNLRFSLLRLTITIPFIVLIGFVMEKLIDLDFLENKDGYR
ncbi:permease [Undibacterium cyanobacteriorum]|uniref:Permease n=1 Tax=Undibacterium cyanobacteriorum TaxID=3073561 RepID=A0ABY9RIT1_9BURK|nr:permease [Undibacterium sp. 20NA77.5]WMW80247.1 permease [Undibacterium sp. 20NA77.5]